MVLAPLSIMPEAWMDLLAEQHGHSVTQLLASQIRFIPPLSHAISSWVLLIAAYFRCAVERSQAG